MGWTRLSWTFTTASNAGYALLRVEQLTAGTAGAKFLVDAALFETTTLLPNATFDTDVIGWRGFNSATVARATNVTNIASIAFSTPTVTVTTSTTHFLSVGQSVTIAGASTGGNNGTFTVASVTGTTTFTITNASGAVQAGVAGTVTASTAYAGSGALGITTPAGANPGASSDGIIVDPTVTYTLSGYMKNILGTTRDMSLQVQWADATDTFISYSSLVTATSLAAGGAWTLASNAAITPPANAYIARIFMYAYVGTATAGWQSAFDAITFGPTTGLRTYFDGSGVPTAYGSWAGGSTASADANASISRTGSPWQTGGYTAGGIYISRTDSTGTCIIRALPSGSSDVKTADGSWLTSTNGYTVYDYEAARGETVTYTAAFIVYNGTTPLASSTYSTTLVTTNDATNWLKPVYAPLLSDGGILIKTEPDFDIDEETGVFKPRGRGYQVVVSGGLFGTSGSFDITVRGASDIALLDAIATHKGVLLWQDPYGKQRYIRLTKRSYSQSGPTSSPIRVYKCGYVEVGPY
jgi:hypothetical protein